ncbi:MAG: MBL fold metallo-hydrolase [Verrucomicrobiae bacterium]|nr:MBL fold metallo-hydrolase [Verrucomicrobiae bacterium]
MEFERLSVRIRRRRCPRGQALAWWLGGGGFCFKTSRGTRIYVDPYLSDAVERIFGQQRAFPAPLTAEEASLDLLIATHWHEDHLDPGSLPVVAARNPKAVLLMPPSAMSRALSWGVARKQIVPLRAGQSFTVKDLTVRALAARHEAGVEGWETPDALCLILEMEGMKVLFSGDTEYDSRLRRLNQAGLDAAFLCINGTGGNMNAHEAALLAWQLGVSTVVPMHHLLWKMAAPPPDGTFDPGILERTYRNLGGRGTVVTPEVGGEIILRRTPAGKRRG